MSNSQSKGAKQRRPQSEILSKIESASAAYDWETARDLATEGLAAPDLPLQMEIRHRLARAQAYDYLARYSDKAADLRIIMSLAETASDRQLYVDALNQLAYAQVLMGDNSEALQNAEEALRLARELDDKGLEAAILNTLGERSREQTNPEEARAYYQEAIKAAHDVGNEHIKLMAMCNLGFAHIFLEDQQAAEAILNEAANRAREIDDLLALAEALNNLSIATRDFARTAYYDRRTRDLADKIGNRRLQIYNDNNMALLYGYFGLYRRALVLGQRAVRNARQVGMEYSSEIDTLARVARDAGELRIARQSYEEMAALAKESNLPWELALSIIGLAQVALDEGALDEALRLLTDLLPLLRSGPMSGEEVYALAWLAAIHLARGENAEALASSKMAVDGSANTKLMASSYTLQDIWWWRYRALAAAADPGNAEETWDVLEEARGKLFAVIDDINDEGLRRNYLNKPNINRAISETWAAEAVRKGISLSPFTDREMTPAALAEQLERIVESGARLAAERDTDSLAEFLLQEFVELSGVERAVVALNRAGSSGSDKEDHSTVRIPYAAFHWSATEGFTGAERQAFAEFAAPIIEQAATKRAPLLLDTAGEVREAGIPELHLRSVLALPLVSKNRVWGVLYGDMRHLFGRLNPNDRDVLSLLANQAGVALENADLVASLEERVAQRTAELQNAIDDVRQRNAELAVINNVQSALASQLDLQTIYFLVGDKIVEIFDAQMARISIFNHEDGVYTDVYGYEDGEHHPEITLPFGIFEKHLLQEKQTLYLRTIEEGLAIHPDIKEAVIEGTTVAESVIFVPLMMGGTVIGSITIQDERPNAFSEDDLRLVSTLASSMSVALQNARLFDETQTLLHETQQRAAELAALSEVGSDISATLDLEKVLQRIASHALELLDISDSSLFLPEESGEEMRGFVAQGNIAEQVLATTVRQGVGILGDIWQTRRSEFINDAGSDPRAITIAGTENRRNEHMMVAPLLSGDDVVGLMAVWREGEPFDDDDLRFLDGLARQAAIAIQNARLYKDAAAAMAKAEQASQAKSTFLANMSHELRTPLNAIIGFTRIVQRRAKEKLPQKQIDNLGKVLASAEHLLGLINSILDIAKIEAGRMDVVYNRVDVASLIELCTMTAGPLLKAGVALQTVIAPDLPAVVSDEDKLKQILLNLLSNAAKFTHQGTIAVNACQEEDMLVIEVADSGIGMDDEALERIFEEFQQADATTRREYGGTGLGLPISKHLAELLGGDLTATSITGQGSTFALAIPLSAPEMPIA